MKYTTILALRSKINAALGILLQRALQKHVDKATAAKDKAMRHLSNLETEVFHAQHQVACCRKAHIEACQAKKEVV